MNRKANGLIGGLQAIWAGVRERTACAGIALRTLRHCYAESIRQARLVDNDRFAQRNPRKLSEGEALSDSGSAQEMPRPRGPADGREDSFPGSPEIDPCLQEFDAAET